jgi:hypothetical protein
MGEQKSDQLAASWKTPRFVSKDDPRIAVPYGERFEWFGRKSIHRATYLTFKPPKSSGFQIAARTRANTSQCIGVPQTANLRTRNGRPNANAAAISLRLVDTDVSLKISS